MNDTADAFVDEVEIKHSFFFLMFFPLGVCADVSFVVVFVVFFVCLVFGLSNFVCLLWLLFFFFFSFFFWGGGWGCYFLLFIFILGCLLFFFL